MNFTAVVVFSLVLHSIYYYNFHPQHAELVFLKVHRKHPVKRLEGICIQDGQLYVQRGFKGFFAVVFLNDLTIDFK